MTLGLTVLANPVLKGERMVPLVKFRSFEEKKAAAPQPKAVSTADGDPDLYEALKAVRRRLADENGVPAYVVFSDKTLKDMAAKVPKTPEQFRQVHGVGEAKLEAYGSIFLRAIAEHDNKELFEDPSLN
jgi:ATP-dependent DNA helicase RecQ